MLSGILIIVVLSLCKAAAKENVDECKYNILTICEGKCCHQCELQDLCKKACKENPGRCGGRV